MDIPLHLDIRPFCVDEHSPQMYTLCALIEHVGRSISTGHYRTYVNSLGAHALPFSFDATSLLLLMGN